MKKLLILIVSVFCFFGSYAQQEAQYTQFMYNKLTLNPAYAGSAGAPCISCIYRSQWIGFDGAPVSQVLNFHSPFFSKRVGFGISLSHDNIGPTDSYNLGMMYAYRMKLNKGTLSIGLRGSIHSYSVDYASLTTIEGGDDDIPERNTLTVMPNFGTGVYYENKKLYAGISIPNLLENDLSSATVDELRNSDSHRHFYFMAGYVLELGSKTKFKPAALMKVVKNTPVDLDINGTFIFMDKFWIGASYRMGGDSFNSIGESIDLLAQYQIAPSIRVGAAYDFTLSKLRNYSDGSIEVQLQYCIHPKHNKLTNPRFF